MLAEWEYISSRQSVKIGDDDFEIFEKHNANSANYLVIGSSNDRTLNMAPTAQDSGFVN